jgi:hypothetical protein
MFYELAKNLKDEGFPQDGSFVYWGTAAEFKKSREFAGPCHRLEAPAGTTLVTSPTLSELIEACGESFFALIRAPDNKWKAVARAEVSGGIFGDTPEEAVARLWRALNKNMVHPQIPQERGRPELRVSVSGTDGEAAARD